MENATVAGTDRMLSGAEASARGIPATDLSARGLAIQRKAAAAMAVCNYVEALVQYKALLPIVEELEKLRATGHPEGLALQLLQRGIEQVEERLSEPRG